MILSGFVADRNSFGGRILSLPLWVCVAIRVYSLGTASGEPSHSFASTNARSDCWRWLFMYTAISKGILTSGVCVARKMAPVGTTRRAPIIQIDSIRAYNEGMAVVACNEETENPARMQTLILAGGGVVDIRFGHYRVSDRQEYTDPRAPVSLS